VKIKQLLSLQWWLIIVLFAIVLALASVIKARCQTYTLTEGCGADFQGKCKPIRGFVHFQDSTVYVNIYYGNKYTYVIKRSDKIGGVLYHRLVGYWFALMWITPNEAKITVSKRYKDRPENVTWYMYRKY
jgi:hypothetical protein